MALTESVAQKLDVPPGMAAAIVQDMAGANPTNKKLSRHELAQKWGKDAEILGEIKDTCGSELEEYRRGLSKRQLITTAFLQQELQRRTNPDPEDPEYDKLMAQLGETSIIDLARAAKYSAETVVTLIDGVARMEGSTGGEAMMAVIKELQALRLSINQPKPVDGKVIE